MPRLRLICGYGRIGPRCLKRVKSYHALLHWKLFFLLELKIVAQDWCKRHPEAAADHVAAAVRRLPWPC